MKYNIVRERENNTLGRKIQQARVKKGLRQTDVVNLMHDYGSTVKNIAYGQWERGEATPSPYQLFSLCMIFGIDNPLEYFTGMNKKPLLNEEGERKVEEYIDDLVCSGKYSPAPQEKKYISVPKFISPAAAGPGNFIADQFSETYDMPEDEYIEGTDYVIEISGDSMEPEYHDGQYVCVVAADELDEGDIGIFILNDCAYIKKYHAEYKSSGRPGSIELISLNPAYNTITVGKSDMFAVCGKVLS